MVRLLAGFLCRPGFAAPLTDIVGLDTDSGLFGDDGAALVMLLRSPCAGRRCRALRSCRAMCGLAQGAEYMLHILDLLKRADK